LATATQVKKKRDDHIGAKKSIPQNKEKTFNWDLKLVQ
jgi:hypothetical protein